MKYLYTMCLIHENYITLVLLAVLPLVLLLWRRFFSTAAVKTTPPGPIALPLIGHMHLIGSNALHIICEEMANKYGDIFSLQFASRKFVVLCSRKLIYEAFVKNAKRLAGRPDLPTFRRTRNGKTGLSLCDYTETYIKNRKTTVRAFHSFLSDKENLNTMLKDECTKMLDLFNNHADNQVSFCPLKELQKIIPSIIIKLMFGQCVKYTDESFMEIVNAYNRWFEVAEGDNPADFIEWLEHLPNKRLDTVSKCVLKFEEFTNYSMSLKKKETSFVSEYLANLTNGNDEEIAVNEFYEIRKVISDIIGAGFDTSVSSIAWGLLYLIRQKEVLMECQKEIHQYQFSDDIVSISDKEMLPYLSATVYEIIRLSSVAPLGLPHCTHEDVNLGGYTIEKDTIVLSHLWMANHDESYWEDANVMKPLRYFLNDKNLNSYTINEILSFSAGVRRCPGDQTAFSMIFVILGTILNNYKLDLIKPPEDMLPLRGITLKPKYYEIQLNRL